MLAITDNGTRREISRNLRRKPAVDVWKRGRVCRRFPEVAASVKAAARGGEAGTLHRFHSRVGMISSGPDPWLSATGSGAGLVQTSLGSFVSDAYADDCARFLSDLRERLSAGGPPAADPPSGDP